MPWYKLTGTLPFFSCQQADLEAMGVSGSEASPSQTGFMRGFSHDKQSGQKCGVYSFYCSGDQLGAYLCPNMIGHVLVDIHFWQNFIKSWRICIVLHTVGIWQFFHFSFIILSLLTDVYFYVLHWDYTALLNANKLWKLKILRFHRQRQEKGSLDDGILPPSSINYSIYKLRFDTITWASCSCHLAVYERLMSRCWTVETIIVFFSPFSFPSVSFYSSSSDFSFLFVLLTVLFLWRNVLFTVMKQSFTCFFLLKPITMPSFFFLTVKFPSHSELN